MSDYQRMAKAIDYLVRHRQRQPSLEDVAQYVHLSPSHFQRQFQRWVGVSPKRYLQALTVSDAKALLARSTPTLAVADQLGLSSASRLYDHFIQLEAMTPGEYQRGGEGLHIQYSLHDTPFGQALLASTQRGLCCFNFIDSDDEVPQQTLQAQWPKAGIVAGLANHQAIVDALFSTAGKPDSPLSLHVRGTNFQIQVWRALLRIPAGSLSTYRQVAQAINRPTASRAVGQAIGANPVGLLIPCHRVIRESGELGGYRWGLERKQALLCLEEAQTQPG
ncbi:methylated-DNA--[protein]-cysteine S-methyltransferase [Spongiibacter nanhainus]|uniref:methylated-DNA--[protein]-cysteine S-methyltransferase n=1 Tax=Spongiibacter nanhainus TaxID=2794344 RepID=A0A7T4UNS0_9GAMM|nr:methylated-DNA--[protein]-cysteine S-methyltransferase [Spongiibacter nanhainus]QQD16866.1 methylated-DNA--[protein]-cysteine S-methyltransferase [Spongiibacter nanhainus]